MRFAQHSAACCGMRAAVQIQIAGVCVSVCVNMCACCCSVCCSCLLSHHLVASMGSRDPQRVWLNVPDCVYV